MLALLQDRTALLDLCIAIAVLDVLIELRADRGRRHQFLIDDFRNIEVLTD